MTNMKISTFNFTLLIAFICTFNASKMTQSYSLENANLRKFGVNFGERPGSNKLNEMRKKMRQEQEERERIQNEIEMKRMNVIRKYLVPLEGSTSFLKDFINRF